MDVHMKYDLVLLTIGCKSIVTICAGVLGLLLFYVRVLRNTVMVVTRFLVGMSLLSRLLPARSLLLGVDHLGRVARPVHVLTLWAGE